MKLPAIPGRDVSGTVEAQGHGFTRYQPGDEVYAFLSAHAWGYADFAVAAQDEAAFKPTTLDHVHAAAVPLAAVTAWQALFDHGHLQPGQRVLIHGAAGRVGHFAVQFAKAKGATVIATAGPHDLAFLKDLGADQVIDYTQAPFEDQTTDIDLVIDLIAGETQERSWKVPKHGGAIISTLQQLSTEKAAQYGARAEVFHGQPDPRAVDGNR